MDSGVRPRLARTSSVLERAVDVGRSGSPLTGVGLQKLREGFAATSRNADFSTPLQLLAPRGPLPRASRGAPCCPAWPLREVQGPECPFSRTGLCRQLRPCCELTARREVPGAGGPGVRPLSLISSELPVRPGGNAGSSQPSRTSASGSQAPPAPAGSHHLSQHMV